MNAAELIHSRIEKLKNDVATSEARIVELQLELERTTNAHQATIHGLRELSAVAAQISNGKPPNEPKTGKKPKSGNPNKPAFFVLALIKSTNGGLTASEIWEQVKDRIKSKSDKPRNIIGTTLYNLKKRGLILHDVETGKYTAKNKQ